MGEDLSLPGRDAIRTPMQWTAESGAGFSDADPAAFVAPLVRGRFSPRSVNARDQQRDPESLLTWFGQLVRALRECPEIGTGSVEVLDVPLPRSVLAHRFDSDDGSIVALHNLADRAATVDLGRLDGMQGRPWDVFADDRYDAPTMRLAGLHLNGWGYRWIRLS